MTPEKGRWRVAVNAPLRQLLTYEGNSNQLSRGQWVQVPLGRRQTVGLCWGPDSEGSSEYEIKEIQSLVEDQPPWSENFLRWLEWLSQYYIHPLGLVAAMALPPLQKNSKGKARKNSVTPDVGRDKPPVLSEEQKKIVDQLKDEKTFSTHLIFGVTGSGKTEIYLHLLEEVLARGQSGLVLVPEISLTPQLIHRFSQRFGENIAVLHSQLTDRERTNQWWDVVEGRKKILIGARSALFCPVPDLGLIIVDEEHEPSYKQDEKLKYHGRDAAVMMGKMMNCPVLLGSATPSLESWKNVLEGKYQVHKLLQRVANRSLPEFEIVDFKKNKSEIETDIERKRQHLILQEIGEPLPFWMSPELYEKMKLTFADKNQCALFLNRRGLAQMVICPCCGHTRECPNCDISLTLHASSHLICHYCDYHENFKTQCPDCREGELRALGLGTERIEKDLERIFPQARWGRADRDEIQNRGDLEKLIADMENGEIDGLIGTQMIAKGLDFPRLKLVAIVLADIGFNLPDFRATERSFQLITQMSGRSGRHVQPGESPGLVLVQTYNKDHDSLLYSQKTDFVGFAEQELQHRKALNYPPYGKLICFRIQGSRLQDTQTAARRLAVRATQLKEAQKVYEDLEILGPAQAPLARLRGRFRYHLLLKGSQSRVMNHFIQQILGDEKWLPPSVKVFVDVDPIHLL